MTEDASDIGLTRREVSILVYKWIGVSGGYLGNFSYASHQRFWLEVCDVHIDTSRYQGTTRQHFEETLFNAEPKDQAAILRAILDEYPISDNALESRNQGLERQIRAWITRLESGRVIVEVDALRSASEVVKRALGDADSLLRVSGPQSAVDRVHTAMHGYLRSICDEASIAYPTTPSMTQLLKALRRGHAAFAESGPREDDIRRITNSLATILDALNPLRNSASVAHPNEALLGDAEALLVINTVRTLLAYLEAKLALPAGAAS